MFMELPSNSITDQTELLKWEYSVVIDSLFSKSVQLKPCFFETAPAILTDEELISQLTQISVHLNGVKAKIPNTQLYNWRRHTSFTHPLRSFIRNHSKNACHIEYMTQAFFKFYEILTSFSHLCFPSGDVIRTLHLCEAPGAFLSAINVYLTIHKIGLSWSWSASSLNPHYEWNSPFDMLLDDELITSTYSNWLFGPDNSGDILKWTDEYVSLIAAKNGKFHLITADGSRYCQERPEEQERIVFPLLQKQVEVSLLLLRSHGTFIMKMYTSFLYDTVSLMFHLLECFQEVYSIKPSCSKPGNSEVYLLCSDYISDEHSAHRLKSSISYRKSILESSRFFAQHQIQMIEFNLATFEKVENSLKEFIEQKKSEAARYYEQKFCLSEFDKFAIELSSVSFTMQRRRNPWKFSDLNGHIEGLKNITSEEKQIIIENMTISEMMRGKDATLEQYFDLFPCWICDCCQWIYDFWVEKWSLEECLELGDAPSATKIRHTLFLELKTMVLLQRVDIHDFCDTLHANVANLNWEKLFSEKSVVNISLPIFSSHLDFIIFLEEMFRHASTYQESVIQINIPCNYLILTRFAASFIAFCSLCYQDVALLSCDAVGSKGLPNKMICKKPHGDMHRRRELSHYLSIVKKKLMNGASVHLHVYRFVPESQFRCKRLYASIIRYNEHLACRLLTNANLMSH